LKGAFVPAPDEVRKGTSSGGVIVDRATPAFKGGGGSAAATAPVQARAIPRRVGWVSRRKRRNPPSQW
jgi:hypothetical protein